MSRIWLICIFVAWALAAEETPDGVPIETLKATDGSGKDLKVPQVQRRIRKDTVEYVVKDKAYTHEQFREKFPIVAELLSGDLAEVRHEKGTRAVKEAKDGEVVKNETNSLDNYVYKNKTYTAAEFKKEHPHKFDAIRLKEEAGVTPISNFHRSEKVTDASAEEIGDEPVIVSFEAGRRRFQVGDKELSEKDFRKRYPQTYERLVRVNEEKTVEQASKKD